MTRQARIALVIAVVLVLVAILFFWAFGGMLWSSGEQTRGSGGGYPYQASASMSSLRDAGWQVTEAPEEAPDPNTGVSLAGYLQTTAPDGEPIDLEFYESPEDAQAELPEAMKEGVLGGTTVENVLAYDVENEFGQLSPENLETLRTLLKGA